MSQLTDQLTAIISKPSNQRAEAELETFLPWLRKRVEILGNINDNELLELVKCCQYVTCSTDDVIIRQGEQGDRMFVLLRGAASVYIDPLMTGEEDSTTLVTGLREQEEEKVVEGGLDRSSYGRFIMKYDSGESFGEAALLSEDKTRNATVFADADCQMMVIDQLLFDKALKSHEEQLQTEILRFLESQPIFSRMSSRFKRLLQLSLRRVLFPANVAICKQGNLVTSLYFVTRGEVSIWTVPSYHQRQYPYLGLSNAGAFLLKHSKSNENQAGSGSLDSNGDLSTKSSGHSQRRKEGATSTDRDRRINLCSVQSGEVVGDVEIAHRLDTYMTTVTCSTDTAAFRLDVKNLERIVGRRNPYVMEVLKQKVQEKLEVRAASHVGKDVPLLSYLISHKAEDRLTSARTMSPIHVSKELPSRDIQMQHLINKFRRGEAELIEPRVPGALIYKEQMRDRARIRANIRRRTTTRSMLNETRRKTSHRQPRSRRAILATLSYMTDKNTDNEPQYKTHGKAESSRDPDSRASTGELNPGRESVRTAAKNVIDSSGVEHPREDNRTGKRVAFHLPELQPLGKGAAVAAGGDPLVRSQGQGPEPAAPLRPVLQERRSPGENEGSEVTPTARDEMYRKREVPATSSSPTKLPPLAKPELQKVPVQRGQPPPTQPQANDQHAGGHNDSVSQAAADKARVTDYASSDTDLDDLENRVKSFLVLHCPTRNKVEMKLPKLRRYTDVMEAAGVSNAVRPGGKVWIKAMTCPFATSSIKVTNHQHIRHHMLADVSESNDDNRPREIDLRHSH